MKVELIEKAAEIVGDNQLLVNIVSKRVYQLNHGSDPFIPTTPDMQCGDIALTEIIEGKITWRAKTAEEMQSASAAAAAEAAAEDMMELPTDSMTDFSDIETVTITPDL